MTRDEATPLARRLMAAACELRGDNPEYCQFMRDGAYDDEPGIQAAIAALTIRSGGLARPKVVELAA